VKNTVMVMKTELVSQRFPWLFLILAYGLSWLCWIPVALTGRDFRESPVLMAVMFLGVFGPGAAGIFLTYREQGKEGGRDFWQRVFDFRRIRPLWIALILLLWPAMHLVTISINGWFGGSPPEFAFIKQNASLTRVVSVLILYVVQAALEELGWRGYMLDRLQAVWSPLAASLVLGIFHAFWHLPTMWIPGTGQSEWNFGGFIAFVIANSIFATWCYNDNRRSTLAVILLHAMSNLAAITFRLPGSGEHIFTVLLGLGAIIIAAIWIVPKRKLAGWTIL
jgi:membrane protease YdiL (CAAX protease family)